MPRHQIRNPSLLDPWRARGSTASPSAPLAPPFSASLFFSFPVTVAPDSLSLSLFSSSFPPHSPALLLFSQRFSRSLCISVSRERSHAKSLKGDEQTTSLSSPLSCKYFRSDLCGSGPFGGCRFSVIEKKGEKRVDKRCQ